MIGRTGQLLIRFALPALAWLLAPAAAGQVLLKEPPAEIRDLEVTERLGERVPLDTVFTDSEGRKVRLGEYFNQGKPVILVLGYYDCPLVCPLILERLQQALNKLDYTVGEDFNVVVISFDPRNTTEMAANNRMAYLSGYNRSASAEVRAGWTFHTSDPMQMRPLADAIGFEYRYIDESGEYSHPVALTFLTPTGEVSRYIYGFDYVERDMKLSLLGASNGAIAQSIGDRLLWFCYHYDPKTGRHTLAAFRVMQAGALITLFSLGTLIAVLRYRERRAQRKAQGIERGNPVASRPVRAAPAISGHHA